MKQGYDVKICFKNEYKLPDNFIYDHDLKDITGKTKYLFKIIPCISNKRLGCTESFQAWLHLRFQGKEHTGTVIVRAIVSMGNNFCDTLFAFLYTMNHLIKKSLLPKEQIPFREKHMNKIRNLHNFDGLVPMQIYALSFY